MSQSSFQQQSNTDPANPQPQAGYLPDGNGSSSANSTDMLIQFADGEKVLPAWIVAHHGGNAEIEKFRGQLVRIKQAEFIKTFFDMSSSNHLSGLQKGIVASHIGKLKQEQRFKLGR